MKKFALYQNHTLMNNADLVNELGWEGATERHPSIGVYMKHYLKPSFDPPKVLDFDPEELRYYTLVAVLEAEDLEDAFALSNGALGAEAGRTRITPIAKRMTSGCVGDILVSDEGHHKVMGFGFSKLRFV